MGMPSHPGDRRGWRFNRDKARELRRNTTEAERVLWKHICRRQLEGYRFPRQQPIGPYIVDFFFFEKRLAIELDGGQHSEQVAYDTERTKWLVSQGFHVLRFWKGQVLGEIESVKEMILVAFGSAE